MLLFLRFVFVCLLIVSVGALASPGSVVFNSFKDRSLALKESAQISRQFGIEARIEEARVNGLTYHRVLGPVMDQTSARELIRQAKAGGLPDVWVLSSKERPMVRMERRAPDPKAPVSTPVVELPTSEPKTTGCCFLSRVKC
ncbi:MAG: SPOR domain-containing protein [Candidatus Azotimanducaceae bacterium]